MSRKSLIRRHANFPTFKKERSLDKSSLLHVGLIVTEANFIKSQNMSLPA